MSAGLPLKINSPVDRVQEQLVFAVLTKREIGGLVNTSRNRLKVPSSASIGIPITSSLLPVEQIQRYPLLYSDIRPVYSVLLSKMLTNDLIHLSGGLVFRLILY